MVAWMERSEIQGRHTTSPPISAYGLHPGYTGGGSCHDGITPILSRQYLGLRRWCATATISISFSSGE